MTGQSIVKFIAQQVGLYDSKTGNYLTNRYLSKDDLLEMANLAYTQDVYPLLKQEHPQNFIQDAYADNWEATGVASATSTGSTLVCTTNIFNSTMIGATLYNSTDGSSVVISGFTDGYTVTTNTEVNDTWDGDTFYVLSGKIIWKDDLADAEEADYISIKYSSADTNFKTAQQKTYNDVHEDYYEAINYYSEFDPIYWLSTVRDTDGNMYKTLEFRPKPTTNISDAIFLRYTQLPANITYTTDMTLRGLPGGSQLVVGWGGALLAAITMRISQEEIDRIKGEKVAAFNNMMSFYKPMRKFRRSPHLGRHRDSEGRIFIRTTIS